jgi:hypothetical protein
MTTNPPKQIYRVTVIEWLSHSALLEAESSQAAEAQARRLWEENAEHEAFRFEDSGIDGVVVDPA